MEWTSNARQRLHEHVSKSTNQASTSEIYNDLFTDLTAHVEEERHQKGVSKINTESLQTVLTSMGGDEFGEIENKPALDSDKSQVSQKSKPTQLSHQSANSEGVNSTSWSTYSPLKQTRSISMFKTVCAWLFTIIIPLVALIVELNAHESRSMFFDPIPTWIHVILIALVPITFISVSIYREKLDPKAEAWRVS